MLRAWPYVLTLGLGFLAGCAWEVWMLNRKSRDAWRFYRGSRHVPGEAWDALDDGVDHACGECGRGIPSYQAHGSLCGACLEEIAREGQ
jgi:hypothetical protein